MPCYSLLGLEICIPSLDEIVNMVVTPITNFVTWANDGIVSAFTTLYNTLANIINSVWGWISEHVNWLWSQLSTYIRTLWGWVSEGLNWLWFQLSGSLGFLWGSISTGLNWLWSQLSGGLQNLWGYISGGLDSLGAYLTGVFNASVETLNNGITWMGAEISSALEDAGKTLLTAFDGMGNAISGAMGGIFSGFGLVDPGAVEASTLDWMYHSPIIDVSGSPWWAYKPIGDIKVETIRLANEQRQHWFRGYILSLLVEGASLGQIETPSTMLFTEPATKASMDLAGEWFKLPYDIGFTIPAQRYWNSVYTPNIPPYQDVIEIYVREGYREDHWVELPAEMVQNFMELGYSDYWTKRLWGKHWVYPSPTQLYEMLHRSAGNFPEIGVTSDILREMLKLHDFEPKWRMPLEAISWNTWRIYDIRTGWEMGELSDEALVKRLIDTGYEPKDARLLAEVQKMFVLRTEIDGLLSESDMDFIGGWISEDQLTANYAATPYNLGIVEMRVSKAKLRQERADKADLKAALINRYVKGDLSETEFSQELSHLGIQQNRIAIEVTKANATKLKTVREETTVTSKALTESTYSKAYRVGSITEERYRKNLANLKYSPEDIDLLVDLNTPQKPAPEEIATLTLGELKAAFKALILPETELTAELNFRLYTPTDIRTIISTELAKLKEEDLRKAFRTGRIVEDTLRKELERREYKPEDIDSLVGEEKAKVKPLVGL